MGELAFLCIRKATCARSLLRQKRTHYGVRRQKICSTSEDETIVSFCYHTQWCNRLVCDNWFLLWKKCLLQMAENKDASICTRYPFKGKQKTDTFKQICRAQERFRGRVGYFLYLAVCSLEKIAVAGERLFSGRAKFLHPCTFFNARGFNSLFGSIFCQQRRFLFRHFVSYLSQTRCDFCHLDSRFSEVFAFGNRSFFMRMLCTRRGSKQVAESERRAEQCTGLGALAEKLQ